jgi:hypothetical protein
MTTTRSARPVGYCIYCGANECDLLKEHVVPFALGGNVVLPKASCSECAAITSKFERFWAREVLGPFRVRTGAPTRRPNLRPTDLPLVLIDSDGGRREVEVPSNEHPATLMLPVFAKPRILSLLGEERRETFIMWLALPDSDVLSLPQRHNASLMKLGSFEILSFCRLLAKIAHGAAFLDLHWTDSWEPLLPDLILGRTDKYDILVGGTDRVENAPEEMGFPVFFESVDIGEERYLVAELRLFAGQGTPTCRVVVGRRR